MVSVLHGSSLLPLWGSSSGRSFDMAFDPATIFTTHCDDIEACHWGICASSGFLDLIVLSLPVREIWRLELSKAKERGMAYF